MSFARIVFLSIIAQVYFLSSCVFAAQPIKIGALFAITGPASFLGEPERNTAQMVIDEINKAGGIKGRPLQLIAYDTQGDTTKAKQLVNKLIKIFKHRKIFNKSLFHTRQIEVSSVK